MTIISKTAGALSATSCIIDMHETAKIYAKKSKASASANGVIRRAVASQMTDELSYKDAQIKNWAGRSHIFLGFKETIASAKGYIGGFIQSGAKYLPNLALSAIAILSSSKSNSKGANAIANIAAAGLGLLHGGHFIKTATGIGERKDYLA